MKKPDQLGRASKILYGNVDDVESKVQSPPETNNFPEPPSIIPGVSYPCTEREDQIIKYTWYHAKEMQRRGLL